MRIKDTLERHLFRNRIHKGLRARETMMKHTYNRIFINRIGKLLVCMTLQKRIVSNAFQIAKKNINDRAAWNVQRVIRGYIALNKPGNMQKVKEALSAKQNLRQHVSA